MPVKSELIFNKYGHRYFLEKLFDESNPSGSAVLKSGYEQRIAEAAAEGQGACAGIPPGTTGELAIDVEQRPVRTWEWAAKVFVGL